MAWMMGTQARGGGSGSVIATVLLGLGGPAPAGAQAPAKKPNILVIFGDDVGQTNIGAYCVRRGGIPDAEHRPDRARRHDVHGLLRREQLHGGPFDLHHRPDAQADRPVEGRHSRARRWAFSRATSPSRRR